MGKRFARFYRCLAFAHFWKVKFWRSFIKCQYFKDAWTDFHKNIYLYIFILGFFSKMGKTRVSHWVKMMTWWPGRKRWPKWLIDPVTQLPSSMSDIHHNPLHQIYRSPRHWAMRPRGDQGAEPRDRGETKALLILAEVRLRLGIRMPLGSFKTEAPRPSHIP